MIIDWNKRQEHADKLKRGLTILGPTYVAQLCWWCDGTTARNFEHCSVCGKDGYASALGLLINNQSAPRSVVNQVLVAADRNPGADVSSVDATAPGSSSD